MKSKDALDKIIKKSRAHFYKPIQIAEILHHHRVKEKFDPLDLESYRNTSKKWRDEKSQLLVGNISTSSQKFQDNLFEANAIPPELLKELIEFNDNNDGLVENYIYHHLLNRLSVIYDVFKYTKSATPDSFELDTLLSMFVKNPGLKRSIDKAYEITVYALFSSIVTTLKVEMTLSIKNPDKEILNDFKNFISMVLGLDSNLTEVRIPARIYRVGVTNAADRGLDMWSNFGPAIQVKHVSLNEEMAEKVTDSITADNIILVCLDADAPLISKILEQMPFSHKISGIITISDLREWYSLCFSETYKDRLGDKLLDYLLYEFTSEFPSIVEIEPFIIERGYDSKKLNGIWKIS